MHLSKTKWQVLKNRVCLPEVEFNQTEETYFMVQVIYCLLLTLNMTVR